MPAKFYQIPHTILMVRPAAFGFNPETQGSNAFQKQSEESNEVIQAKALREFNEVINLLDQHGIPTHVVDDTLEPLTTDAIFPNNWFTTHEDGKIILYPMMAASRRKERRADIVELLKSKYKVNEVIDLCASEEKEVFLEGTGSIIFDHPNKFAYACLSDRTNEELFKKLCSRLDYKPILFHSVDENGVPIYHTNVMMWIGESLAAVCLDSIKDEDEQGIVLETLANAGHKVIALSFLQMNSFAGNMFEVKNKKEEPFLLLSQTAFQSLLPGQLLEMEKHLTLLPVGIDTIEESGGGSIRCMIAGIHLMPQ